MTMMIRPEEIHAIAETEFPLFQTIRRHIHEHPELSFEEHQTSAYVRHWLEAWGIPYKAGYVETGIVAHIEGRNPTKRVLALRADMDALPIEELNKVPYRSQNPGVMHACGHDVHTACALGAAYILHQLKDRFEGTVKFIFQPGEELLPGGASLMIKEGALEHPKAEMAIAQHVFPSMETGKVGFRSGMYMASTDEIYLTILGKGGHAAMPAEYINPLLVASEVLLSLQEKYMGPAAQQEIPTVLAFGKIEGKGATNVIPDKVDIEGTFRTMNETWRDEVHRGIRETVEAVCQKYKASARLNIMRGYPFLVNAPELTEHCRQAAVEYLGVENVEELPLRMTAEDFAYISQEVPSCFYRLGTGNKSKGIVSGVHTATFDIDEQALKTGAGLMAWLTVKALAS